MTDRQLISVARGMRAGILGKRPSADMCMDGRQCAATRHAFVCVQSAVRTRGAVV